MSVNALHAASLGLLNRGSRVSLGFASIGLLREDSQTPLLPTGGADSIGYDIIRSTRLEKLRREDDEMIMTVIAAFMRMIQ